MECDKKKHDTRCERKEVKIDQWNTNRVTQKPTNFLQSYGTAYKVMMGIT